jgi:hypothetical protein
MYASTTLPKKSMPSPEARSDVGYTAILFPIVFVDMEMEETLTFVPPTSTTTSDSSTMVMLLHILDEGLYSALKALLFIGNERQVGDFQRLFGCLETVIQGNIPVFRDMDTLSFRQPFSACLFAAGEENEHTGNPHPSGSIDDLLDLITFRECPTVYDNVPGRMRLHDHARTLQDHINAEIVLFPGVVRQIAGKERRAHHILAQDNKVRVRLGKVLSKVAFP